MSLPRKILVTSALPYANGSIHIGHLVEYIQTDIWVRFQKLCGHDVTYVCGDDAHGTPIMLRAKKEGLDPETFVARMNQEHQRDFARFGIAFDSFYSTHSPENRTLSYRLYERLVTAGHIVTRDVEQFFDPSEKIFLPDRFIRGTCPGCKAPDQYGDSCEVCGKHYDPTDLIEPRSAVSGVRPELRTSRHFFLRLENFRPQLRELFETTFVDPAIRNKLQEWFAGELKDWDISRDAPFFGFEIPGQPGKYFYNWLDAPIGYLASLAHHLGGNVDAAEAAWQDPETEVHHFIGKDITYFHALFWPATLMGAGLRVPTRLAIHGFLTVNGEKMSKSRGTFINAAVYAQHMDPQWLRYYFASKLGATPEDLDLSMEDFEARVNSELVGKIANLISRAAPILTRNLDGQLGLPAADAVAMLNDIRQAADPIAACYESRQFAAALRNICALADKVNKYLEVQAPWALVKKDPEAARGVLTAALESGRILTIYLKPVLPDLAAKVEKILAVGPQSWIHSQEAMLPHVIEPFERLVDRIDPKQVTAMIESSKESLSPVTAAPPAAAPAAEVPQGEPLAPVCTFDQFLAVDLRVALVLSAEAIAQSDKMMKVTLDVGELGQKTILAGIKLAYTPEKLQGRLIVYCANLAPRKMKFGTSEGMILAAGPGGAEVFVLSPDSGAKPGQRVH